MSEDKQRFVDSLQGFVAEVLRQAEEGSDYVRGAVKIIDARNCLFTYLPQGHTDEEDNSYAIREMCTLDEEMETVPNRKRIEQIARSYFD